MAARLRSQGVLSKHIVSAATRLGDDSRIIENISRASTKYLIGVHDPVSRQCRFPEFSESQMKTTKTNHMAVYEAAQTSLLEK